MDDLRELATWVLLFVALNWKPATTTLRDRLFWRRMRTDP